MKEYNANEVRDSLIKEDVIYCQKENYTFGVSRYVEGASISFFKDGDIKFLFQAYDLGKSKTKDKRPEFVRISYYINNDLIEFNLVIDFDEAHIKNKKVHLNYDYVSRENLKKYSPPMLKLLDHFNVVSIVNEKEMTIIVNFEDTLLSLLDFLHKKGFYQYIDSFSVGKIHPSDNDYLEKVNKKLEGFLKINEP